MAPRHILFLCTYNAGRSIIAESLVNTLNSPHYHAFSAGDAPVAHASSDALSLLARKAQVIRGLYPKHWQIFSKPNAPHIDVVITLCNNAKGEICANLPGYPLIAHWDTTDPSSYTTQSERAEAFSRLFQELQSKISDLVKIPLSLQGAKLVQKINSIGWRNLEAQP